MAVTRGSGRSGLGARETTRLTPRPPPEHIPILLTGYELRVAFSCGPRGSLGRADRRAGDLSLRRGRARQAATSTDEDIYLSVDGSATIYLNASVPALVNLRGLDLDIRPTANVDRAKIRSLFTTDATRVTRVSRWRRFGRQFVQIRISVDDVTKLGSVAPFDWATYQLDRHDDIWCTASS